MKLACIFGSWSLSLRGSLDFESIWEDPRGLTGSELAVVRVSSELAKLGHEVHLFTVSSDAVWEGVNIHSIDDLALVDRSFDAAVSFNEPDLLRMVTPRLRVCQQLLNDFGYCHKGFDDFVDLFVSPSEAHRARSLTDPSCRVVERAPTGFLGSYTPDPSRWVVIPLGCDPERYQGVEKVRGRVVYCSSPDRGLHWLLHAWPLIKLQVPEANLRIFYRIQPWIESCRALPFSPTNDKLKARALFIEACIPRLSKLDVEVCGSVSRRTIETELAQAQVLAYPCDPVSWTEGFSCAVLEGCAAAACPVISSVDALGAIYGSVLPMVPRGDWDQWKSLVVYALQDQDFCHSVNVRAAEFARARTWNKHAEQLAAAIRTRLAPERDIHFRRDAEPEGRAVPRTAVEVGV